VSALAIMITRRCNMACEHCSVESGPKAGEKGPSLEDLLEAVRDAAAAGVRSINVTGGEPMLRERVALAVIRECRRLGIATRLTTNGFWSRNPERAHRTLAALLDAGLGALTVSYDRFHAAFQGPEPVAHIARAAEMLGFFINVNVTRLAEDDEIESLIGPFADLPAVRLRFYDVQPVGAARHLPGIALRSEVEGFCSACGIPALTDDGRVTACNGPSYFLPVGNPLAIGSLAEAPLGELLARHRDDPILETIRTEGPGGLRDALRQLPGFESFPFRDRYSGMCELCHHITSSPDAVSALRSSLSTPVRVARRLARSRIIEEERVGRTLSRVHVNTGGAARAFLAVMTANISETATTGRVLGRADFDWRAAAETLIAAGLARPILDRIEDPDLARWAPGLFGSMIRRAAVVDEARELSQREAIERVAAVLRKAGVVGTVVGGSGLWDWNPTPGARGRGVDAIDLVVEDPIAARTARASMGNGSRPVVIRIRSAIVPGSWGVPDATILAAARPLPDPALEGLRRLSPTDAFVCALVEASAGGLRAGLETGWDVSIALGQAVLDVDRALTLVSALHAPRAFWVPAGVLAESLGVPIPAGIFARAPDDRRQRRLEHVAARRLFRASSGSAMAEWSFRWAWPALAAGPAADVGRRLPSAATRATRELPSAWREIGANGMSSAFREARRLAGAWTSAAR